MRIRDVTRLALKQLMERRLRTILTMLAIAVGVTSIIALSAQVEGVKTEILKNLEKLGPNTIMVTRRTATLFTDVDIANLKSISGVEAVAPLFIFSARVSGVDSMVTVIGVSSLDLLLILGEISLMSGELYYDVPSPQAIMGYNIAVDVTGMNRFNVGQPILVQTGSRNIMLIGIGILNPYGASTIVNPDNSIFISLEYIKTLLRVSGYTTLVVKVRSLEEINQVMENIRYMFGNRANIMSVEQITSTVQLVTSQVNLLLMSIAATSFIAAGLGTFNIMTISVLERIREIGILKAIGMKDKGVLKLYLFQGLILGCLGSLIGIIFGLIISYVIPLVIGDNITRLGIMGRNTSYTPIITIQNILVATIIAIMVTLIASAYPSWKAAKMKPVDALRYE
ncbi:MAG: ABC transporter permease [Candidatus Methanomethylicia archaeon]|nr:ABC transporter permease [Candidatus Methanomethylicia archaeon]MCX8168942.1 ABC transporter permease [Candidatus Methanomethylicia archaeon]MDW7988674.1 FtsX-like permease family protein [Nitrososphaerota archaeon]